jgi:SOS-response transcriptional repressor LexA
MGDIATRTPGREGRIRQSDDSLNAAGINAGDLVIIDLTKQPKEGELCAAFTPQSELVVRYFQKEKNGDIRLSQGSDEDVIQQFAPEAVIIFGRVRKIVKNAEKVV